MNSLETDSYLANIEEFVFDERKVVTFSWLSKSLGIHSNVSKQLLHTFFENSPKKNEICATFLVIGVPNNGETYQVSIVKDKDLEELENSLKSITSKHIYSIQKCSDISDLNILYAAQNEEPVNTISKGISAIDFNCSERGNAVMTKLKLDALPVISNLPCCAAKKPTSQATSKSKSPVKITKKEQSSKNNNSEEEKESESKTENKKTAVPSMFKKSTDSKKKPTGKMAANNKKVQGIGAFFSKTTSKPNTEVKKETASDNVQKENEQNHKVKERLSPLKENKATLNINCNENKNNSKAAEDTEQESPVNSKKSNKKSKPTSKKESAKLAKKSSGKKTGKEQKKRKRLVVMSDSDSNNSSDDDEVMREPTPEPEPTVMPINDMDDIVCGTPEPSRKRKKKLVSKTFQTPEGYMRTEKQYIDVSCSEDEESVPEKKFKESTSEDDKAEKQCDTTNGTKAVKPLSKDKKSSPINKIPSPQKTKQSSLMNFFKKK